MKNTEIDWLKKMSRGETWKPEPKVEETQSDPAATGCSAEVKQTKGGGFADVAGFDDLKTKVTKEFIRVIQHPKKASVYRVSPSNMLFYGPPGTGKTYFAEKMAEEMGIPYMLVKPDELGSTYIHGSQLKIRECFDNAIKRAPALLVFDEIDALVPKRNDNSDSNKNGETNEFLVMLNEINAKKVYVLGMTNNLNCIDDAVLRTGRFDQLVYFPMPDEQVRESLFRFYLAKMPADADINYAKLARITEGYSCSDIEYMTRKASMEAFNMCFDLDDDTIVNVTQKMMEDIISEQRYSVSADELARYEQMGKKYGSKEGKIGERRKVGYTF